MPAAHTRHRRRRAIGEINMVPFIDVMLVLLTIFMVTAPLITTGTIKLPTVSKSSNQNPGDVYILSIDKTEKMGLRSKQSGPIASNTTLQDLVKRIQTAQTNNPQLPIVIEADKSLTYDTVMRTMNSLRQAGISQIGLTVSSGSASGSN